MIVLLTNDFGPAFGGIQRYMFQVAQACHESGVEVCVIAPAQLGDSAYDERLPFAVTRVRGKWLPMRIPAMFFSLVGTVIRNRGAHIIASSWYPAGAVATLIPRAWRGRTLVLLHGKEIIGRTDFVKRAIRFILGRIDVVAANGEFVRDLVAQEFPDKHIEVVSCGSDTPTEPLAVLANKRILSVGRLIERKNFDAIVRALPRVLRHHPDARYRVVGAGPQATRLETLARDLGVSAAVDFLGSLDDSALEMEYSNAYCFAMPCKRIGGEIEGFGLVFLEAAAHGLPIIVGRDSGAAEPLSAFALCVHGEDDVAIEDAILQLLNDRPSALRRGADGRACVENEFSWVTVARRLLSLLESPGVEGFPTTRLRKRL